MRFANFIPVLSLLTAFAAECKAFAWGHNEPVQVEHVSDQNLIVQIGLVPFGLGPRTEYTHFTMKNGKNLVIAPLDAKFPSTVSTQKIVWPKGKLLVFVETAQKVKDQRFQSMFKAQGASLGLMSVPDYKDMSEKRLDLFMIPVSSKTQVNQISSVQLLNDSHVVDASVRAASIDSAHLRKRLNQLTGGEPFMLEGKETWITERQTTAARTTTQKYLISVFKEFGIDATLKCYRGMYSGCNVEAFKKGSDASKIYMFTAHMDGVARTNGADDNASSTAAVLEVARILSQENLQYTAGFVLFDQEELGLIGSRAYADNWSSAQGQILGVINMDMIGYDSDNDGKMHLMDCDRPDSVGLTQKMMQVNEELQGGLSRVPACTNRSDHASFWRKNIPAVVLSENFFGNDGNNCYHETCDKVTNMNMDFYEKMVKLLASSAMTLVL